MRKKSVLSGVAALLVCTTTAFAQPTECSEKVEFNPHWYMQVQAGAAHTLGEVKFDKLISPAAALSAGYQFSPAWGLRFGISGWQSKGGWVTPEMIYQYKYLQGNVDVTLDLANLFGKFNHKRTANPYLFAGIGLNGAFDNDEANAIVAQCYDMSYIWDDSKLFFAGRFGAGVNFRVSDCVSLGVELNANMLSDKYNSKKAGNIDWQFNALAGVSFRFGKNHKKVCTAPAPVETPAPAPTPEPEPTPAPAPVPVVKEEPAPVKVAELREDVFFVINSWTIRPSEERKIASLVDFMKANPAAKVVVTGYADAATGTPAVNKRISTRRAESVATALRNAGIAADRIKTESKGDTVQPFAGVEKNRVSICIAK